MKSSTRIIRLTFLITFAVLSAGPAHSATDIQIVNFSAQNLSPESEESIDTGLIRSFSSQLLVGGPILLDTDEVSVMNQLRWFQGMRVDQPSGPNAGLIYLNSLGHSISFTLLDPSFEGYDIYIDQRMYGRISVSQEGDPLVEARLQVMAARIDTGYGNGPQLYTEPSTGNELVSSNSATPPALLQESLDDSESFLIPGDFAGDRSFTIQFD